MNEIQYNEAIDMINRDLGQRSYPARNIEYHSGYSQAKMDIINIFKRAKEALKKESVRMDLLTYIREIAGSYRVLKDKRIIVSIPYYSASKIKAYINDTADVGVYISDDYVVPSGIFHLFVLVEKLDKR